MLAALALALLTVSQGPVSHPVAREGIWRAWLDSPGGELPFQLELRYPDGGLQAAIHNGEERILFDVVQWGDGEVELSMPHYDSAITASVADSGERLDGEWVKRNAGPDDWTRMVFHAEWCTDDLEDESARCRFGEGLPWKPHNFDFRGRWRVDFDAATTDLDALETDAVALIEGQAADLRATFLTPLGDYRFLAGESLCTLDQVGSCNRLRLSCFDGAHAFLFTAEWGRGRLTGDFWSRDSWHETWTAVRDPAAALPDAFELSRWNEGVPLASLAFPDLDGAVRSLGDPVLDGKARIVQLFGTWCPNCNDEAPFLVELDRRYRTRGLSIVGLAFEHTGDFERDAEQVRTHRIRHGIDYPILLAGTSDKAEASKRFPLIDRVRAYPTTLFLDAAGKVRAIHTGFAGPATGKEHEKLRHDFERLIESLLAEAEPGEGNR